MGDESRNSKRCGFRCLGPMMFHHLAIGDQIHLSQECCHAKRSKDTFKGGLVFSNRPVRVMERIRLRVEGDNNIWHGALRVGFTNVNPDSRSLPLPKLAIPDLTDTPGHWAGPVKETFCRAGTVLEFWLSRSGSLHVADQKGNEHRLLFQEINTRCPLWAMIHVYGQTCSILLLGSEIPAGLFTRKSCQIVPPSPTLDFLTSDDLFCLNLPVKTVGGEGMTCVACMAQEANTALPCGHRCLCCKCSIKIYHAFGTCPLCRQSMGKPWITLVAAPEKQDPEKKSR